MNAAKLVHTLAGLAPLLAAPTAAPAPSVNAPTCTVTVSATAGLPAGTFIPSHALGAGLDGHEKGDTARIYTPANIKAMLSTGLRPVSYRLRTELGIETWHWHSLGTWSDAARRQGYWTGDSAAAGRVDVSYGYRLPRRGSTVDQANNDGFSRVDDGDPTSYWKSNPYLDARFTGEDNSVHAQWLLVDFRRPQEVNAVRVQWGTPWATRWRMEYCPLVRAKDVEDQVPGEWRTFPLGSVVGGHGGAGVRKLAREPVRARYFRLVMAESSRRAPAASRDERDGLGYAVRELGLGRLDQRGRFVDLIRHSHRNGVQTRIYASSTDPWHRAGDLDPRVEQPGLDRVFSSGLTNGLPVLIPVGLLYDTPENAAAEVRYLRRRGFAVRMVEMGEEPDGQYVTPEDYGALYIQFTDAIRTVDPTLTLGGPCFQTTISELTTWPADGGGRSWMERFVRYMRRRGRLGDYGFFSFEWYPFDNTRTATAPQLARAPQLLAGVLSRMQRDGLSASIPWLITEYGYSAFSGRPEVDIEGALFNAETVGLFMTLGGDQTYLYGYEPGELIEESPGAWGNNILFLADGEGRARWPMPTYYAARLVSQEWALPGDGMHRLYPASSDARNALGQALVTAYAVYRPDGRWSVMLINKDPGRAWKVGLVFRDPTSGAMSSPTGTADLFQYSRAQYVWRPNGARGRPSRDLPPDHHRVPAERPVVLPPYSLSVFRSSGPPG